MAWVAKSSATRRAVITQAMRLRDGVWLALIFPTRGTRTTIDLSGVRDSIPIISTLFLICPLWECRYCLRVDRAAAWAVGVAVTIGVWVAVGGGVKLGCGVAVGVLLACGCWRGRPRECGGRARRWRRCSRGSARRCNRRRRSRRPSVDDARHQTAVSELYRLDICQPPNHRRISEELRAVVDGNGHATHYERICDRSFRSCR